MKYVITKVYIVDAKSSGEALRILSIAMRDGQDWLFQHAPESVHGLERVQPKGWLTILWEQLFGRRKKVRDDPRSSVL